MNETIATGTAAPEPHSATSTAIVGGGMLGLSLALRLAGRGERVTVLEASPEFGGLASPWEIGGVTWDRHYHVTLASDLRLRALMTELGLERDLRWTQVGTGFYSGGKWHPMNGALDFLKFPPLGLIGKFRLGLTILLASRITDPIPLEETLVEDWLRKMSGKTTFEKIWRPLLKAKLGESYKKASAAFIWAIIVRLYAARRAGIGAEKFGYLPGGYARLLSTLEARLSALGVVLRANTPVARIDGAAGGTSGPAITLADGEVLQFDRVVVTAAAPLAARLVPGLDAGERERLTTKLYGGIVCASLLLDEPLGPYYVSNLTDEWVPFTAVIDMANVVDRSEWGGKAIVYLPKYVEPTDALFDTPDDSIEESFLTALERMYPKFSRNDVRAFKISRVRQVFPIATLRYSQSIPPITTSVPGVFLLNSAHIVNGTLNVNETISLVENGMSALDAAGAPAR